MREELLSKINDEVLVVLPYSNKGAQGDEIKITLNGWKKFCQFNYHFVVIGDFDKSLQTEFPWVEFIHVERVPQKDGQYRPHLDICNKIKIITQMFGDKYDGFIYIADDNYAIKPFNLPDITSIHYHQLEFVGDKNAPTSYWRYDKWKTRQLMDKENFPHINYTTHFPRYYEFSRLKELCDRYNMYEESYVIEDVYFNSFTHNAPILDSTIRLGIWNYNIYKNEFRKAVNNPNIKFVCNSVDGWSKELENSLKEIVKIR